MKLLHEAATAVMQLGWFRTRTDTFHNDVALVDAAPGNAALQWRAPAVAGEGPAPREFHTLSPLPGGRLLLFGGEPACVFGKVWLQCLKTSAEGFHQLSLPADCRARAEH